MLYTTWTAGGPTIWRISPISGRASTCGHWDGRTRSTNSTDWPSTGFAHLAADAIEASQQTFETANVLEDEPGLDLSKLARPTSTWTYMVHDNPLRDDALSAEPPWGVPLALHTRLSPWGVPLAPCGTCRGAFRSPRVRLAGMEGRVWTIPNVLSVIRLVLVPVFLLFTAGRARLRPRHRCPDVQRSVGLG